VQVFLYWSSAGVFSDALVKAVDLGHVTQATIDDKLYRIVKSMFSVGIFDTPRNGSLRHNVTSSQSNTLARKIAAQSSILLRNNGILPLKKNSVGKIAVIGAAAHVATTTCLFW
jgi:beta-glucosidase